MRAHCEHSVWTSGFVVSGVGNQLHIEPQDAVIATRWRVYKAAILLGIAGVILLDLGLLMGYGRMWLVSAV